jgi:NAD(P)H-hydrate epimerase
MLQVLTHRQMKDVDAATVERCGITSFQLMENAAQSVVELTSDYFNGVLSGINALVFCGSGNNGGDGAAVARMLVERGMSVTVIAIDWQKAQEGDAKKNFDSVRALAMAEKIRFIGFDESVDIDRVQDLIRGSDILIDGMFGTGLSRPVSDSFAKIFSSINDRNRLAGRSIPCIAIDIPSGLFADSAEISQPHVEADFTVTFTAPKLANVMAPAKRANGNLLVADIGTTKALIDDHESSLFVSDSEDARRWMSRTAFSADSYKKKRGHVLCVVGASGYEGAAVLSANSAMMSGAGIVTLLTHESARIPIASRVMPEVMVRGFENDGAMDVLIGDSCAVADAVLAGCGIGVTESNREMLKTLIEKASSPIVVDADAISLLSPLSIETANGKSMILTPHEGEFKRLFGTEPGIGENRVENVRTLSMKYGVILVLKGESVLIGFTNGRVVINPTGNSALGKAGNGDNLAGTITGFVAQSNACGGDIEEAVIAAVYTAGLAGDIASERFGERVVVASDVRDSLTDAFNQIGAE